MGETQANRGPQTRCRKGWVSDKPSLDACPADGSRLGEGVQRGLKESSILGTAFGCQQNIGGVSSHSWRGHPRSVCEESREREPPSVPGVSVGSGGSTGAKESTCSHGPAPLALRCRRCWEDVGLMSASPGSSLSLPEVSGRSTSHIQFQEWGSHVLMKREGHSLWREKRKKDASKEVRECIT